MAIVEDQALVLRSQRYRETSRITTVLGRRFGKVHLIAKGAREQKSPFGASLEPLTAGHIVFYLKKERSLHLLKAASVERAYHNALIHPQAYYLTCAALEFTAKMLPDEDPSPEVYDALERFLDRCDREPLLPRSEARLKAFQLHVVSRLGYAPQLDLCTRCDGDLESPAGFGVAEGGLVCGRCAPQGNLLPVSPDTLELLAALVQGKKLVRRSRQPEVDRELIDIVGAFLRYHLPGYQGLRALKGLGEWERMAEDLKRPTDQIENGAS